jgi:hypothetical protein
MADEGSTTAPSSGAGSSTTDAGKSSSSSSEDLSLPRRKMEEIRDCDHSYHTAGFMNQVADLLQGDKRTSVRLSPADATMVATFPPPTHSHLVLDSLILDLMAGRHIQERQRHQMYYFNYRRDEGRDIGVSTTDTLITTTVARCSILQIMSLFVSLFGIILF